VAAADAFFWYAESPVAVQQVGGLVMLDASAGPPDRDAVLAVVRTRLDQLPRFRQRLCWRSRWRRLRWVDTADLDWGWHVPVWELPRPGGRPALHRLVAGLHATPLPTDRPLWRLVLVPAVEPGWAAAVLVAHHAIADGLGLVQQALRLLEPVRSGDPAGPDSAAPEPVRPAVPGPAVPGPGPAVPGPAGPGPAGPGPVGPVRTALATAVGLVQLATDGWARPLPTSGDRQRRFGTLSVPLPELRVVACRHRARVTDVLLSAVAGGLRRVRPDLAQPPDRRLRTIVPLLARGPVSPAEGNLTAAVMIDLPLGPMPEPDRLAWVARRGRRLRSGTRALGSRFVIRAVGLLPAPVPGWFARTVYGGRFFQAIVSNLPGPDHQLSLAGRLVRAAYPIVPLAPRSPLAVGALSWNGELHLGITADPALLADLDGFGIAVRAVLDELLSAGPIGTGAG
jgi:WS/DGAT/MGAT family acyltransferase